MIRVCCVVVTYNPSSEVIQNVEKLLLQSEKVVIVDNGSSNIVLENIKEKYEFRQDVLIIHNKENLGIATALNIGVKAATDMGYDWIATFDQDSSITAGYFDSMFDAYNLCLDQNKVRIISPIYKDGTNNRLTSSDGLLISKLPKHENNYYRFVEFSMTSGNLVNLKLFSEIGFFNDDLFIDQVDHDFCLRCSNAGFKILEVNHAVLLHHLGDQTVHHIFGRSPVATNHSALRRYYMSRNRLFMYKNYYSTNTEWVIKDFTRFMKEILIICAYERDRRNKLAMTWRGVLDSISNKYGKFRYTFEDRET